MRGVSRWGWIIGIVILIGVLVVAFLAYQSVISKSLASDLPPDNANIIFTETGNAEKFIISNFSLLAQPYVHAGNAVIMESVPIPISGEQAVLAHVSGTDGTVLGVIHSNGNFEPVISDGTLKTDLAVTKNGTAVYAANTDPVIWSGVTAPAGPSEDATTEDEEGSAAGPVDTGVPYTAASAAGASAASSLYAVNLMAENPEPRLLGEGRSPRRRVDDSIVAITAQGISKINPESGTSSVILPYPFGDAVGSVISQDGVTALLRTDGNSILDAYRISGDQVTPLGSIVSREPIYGAAFGDGYRVFIRIGVNTVALYHITDAAAYPQPPSAHMSLFVSK